MEWLDPILKLGPQLSANGLLLIATYVLWKSNRDQKKQIDDLQAARIADLQSMLKPPGSGK